jgi:6,7-dimethyl-8-ribityllumazine synthase
MLRPLKERIVQGKGTRFGIVASRYNARYVDSMLKAAQLELKQGGAAHIQVVRVPGAFEIPAVASILAELSKESPVRPAFDALICFGVIFQGQTSHAQHIGWGVTHALAQIQVQHRIPVIHAVFVFEEEEHARVRCLGKEHNRGTEAARTALTMAAVMKSVRKLL